MTSLVKNCKTIIIIKALFAINAHLQMSQIFHKITIFLKSIKFPLTNRGDYQ